MGGIRVVSVFSRPLLDVEMRIDRFVGSRMKRKVGGN